MSLRTVTLAEVDAQIGLVQAVGADDDLIVVKVGGIDDDLTALRVARAWNPSVVRRSTDHITVAAAAESRVKAKTRSVAPRQLRLPQGASRARRSHRTRSSSKARAPSSSDGPGEPSPALLARAS